MAKKLLSVAFIAVLLGFFVKLAPFEKSLAISKSKEPLLISFSVTENAVFRNVSKLGIDLGRWASSGTLQYSQNILMNPGFEGEIERAVVIVFSHDGNSFSDEAGFGYPDHYWKEAEFDIRSGPSAGKKGIIKTSLESGSNGHPEYFSDTPLPPIQENDVIILTKTNPFSIAPGWKINNSDLVSIDPFVNRKNGLGMQSVRLSTSSFSAAKMSFYADTIAERSGNQLPVQGPWQLVFWAKARKEGASLDITFRRANPNTLFFQKNFPISSQWEKYTFDFSGKDGGAPGFLEFSVSAKTPDNPVWLDDIFLGPQTDSNMPFRKEVVDAIQMLQPSYIREFPPLGNTWNNMIASPFNRKSWVSRITGGYQEAIYNYSLLDLLELCEKVGANPWIIIPTTFSDFECKRMGEFLADKASKTRFAEVILEFGSESWNWNLRPLDIPYSKSYRQVSERAFSIISKAAKNRSNLFFMVNGQYTLPQDAMKFVQGSKLAEGMAVAPYFFRTLEKGTPDNEILKKLFKNESNLTHILSDALFSEGKSLAISELNLGTTKGDAKAFERNRVVSGAVSGSALAKRVLESLFSGANPIIINSLGQFDTPDWDINGFVNLWGIVRSFNPHPLFRPTGLATLLLNRVIGGNMYPFQPDPSSFDKADTLTLAAFKTDKGWSAAIVSGNSTPLDLELHFPDDGAPIPNFQQTLDTSSPFATNESREDVKIITKKTDKTKRSIRLTIQSWGLTVLKP